MNNETTTLGFYRHLHRALIGGYLLAAVGLIGAATWYALRDRQERLDETTNNASILARALDEHVRRAFNAVDVLLADVAADIAAAGGVARFSEEKLHRGLRAKRELLPQTRALFVYGPDSVLYADTVKVPAFRLDGKEYEHVRAHHRGDTTSLHVGRPLISKVSGLWALPVTRRIPGPGGRFEGVVGAIFEQKHFDEFYRDLGLSPGQGIALFRTDGVLTFRYPETGAARTVVDFSPESAPFLQGPPPETQRAIRFVSAVDGVERIVAYRRIPDLALVVALSQEVDTILAPWRRDMAAIGIGVASMLAALLVLLWIALRYVTAEQHAAGEVRRLNETLEENVRARTAELEAANKELESFSYSVSHDLRTPLRAISGFPAILRARHAAVLPPDAVSLLERVESAAKRMGQLIEDLLSLARVSRQDMHKGKVELSKLAGEIAAELAEAHPDRVVETRITQGLSAHADPALMRVALQNLLANAWKYSAKCAQPCVEFGEEVAGAERAFYVRDNGAGFDMQYVAQLFRPFHRLHSERDYEGTGIGLAIVDRIIRRHSGRIWAAAAPDLGATFRFTLPAGR